MATALLTFFPRRGGLPRLLNRIHAIGARNLFRWDVRTVCGLGGFGLRHPIENPVTEGGCQEEQGATVEDCGPAEHSTLLRNKFRAPTASFRLGRLRFVII